MKTELITEATASLKKQVEAELQIADPVDGEAVAKLFKESTKEENEQGKAP